MKARSWKQQSEAITGQLKDPKSRSPSIKAHIRLQEALHQCNMISGCRDGTSDKPNRLRTAVSCKLLEELAVLAGPYASMLQILCKELVGTYIIRFSARCSMIMSHYFGDSSRCVTISVQQVKSTYSDRFALDGSKDRMDQLPYYSIAEKLEKQNSLLVEEQCQFRLELDEQLSNMDDLTEKIKACPPGVDN